MFLHSYHRFFSCREKVEDLQNEITKVEKDYRTQIAMQEKKAHENWVSDFIFSLSGKDWVPLLGKITSVLENAKRL